MYKRSRFSLILLFVGRALKMQDTHVHFVGKIFLVCLAGSALLFDSAISCLMVLFLKRKPAIHKTALDSLLRDVLIFKALHLYAYYFVYLFGTFNLTHSYVVIAFLSILGYYSGLYYFVTCLTAVTGKYVYICHGQFLLQLSDKPLYFLFLGLKHIGFVLAVTLDYFGPFQQNPISFNFLAHGLELKRYFCVLPLGTVSLSDFFFQFCESRSQSSIDFPHAFLLFGPRSKAG